MTEQQYLDLEEIVCKWIEEHIPETQHDIEIALQVHNFALYLAGSSFTGAWVQRHADGYNLAIEEE